MKRAIVTGANGFIGSQLVNKLLTEGVDVVSIDIKNTPPKQNLDNPHLMRIEASLSDVENVLSLVPQNDYDALYHLAWRGVNGAEKANPSVQLENIQMAINGAELAQKLGVKKYLCAGTVAERSVESLGHLVKTSGGMMYGVAKHCTQLILETYCKNIGLPFVWMQFSNIYGVGNKTGNLVSYTIGELLNGRDATFGPAEQPYDFIYVDDLIEAVYKLGDVVTTRNYYYIGSGETKKLKDFLLRIGNLAGKDNHVHIGERPDDGIRYQEEMFDITPLTEDIGTYVKTPFDEGIRKTIEWYKLQI